MPIEVTCDGCGSRFRVADAAAGKKGKCKKCGAIVTVPVPAPEPVPAAAEDDLYGMADEPAPARTGVTARPGGGGGAVPPPPPPPPVPQQSAAAAAMMARGVVPPSPNAGDWRKSNNPPKIMAVLKGIGGVLLLGFGLLVAGGAIYGMTQPEDGPTMRRPIRAIVLGAGCILAGLGLIARAFGIGGVFDED
jgi:predicted Zn finger-like uncharacterized protein